MDLIRKYVIGVLCIFMFARLAAQEYPLQNYTVRDGLSNANVFRIYQDKMGFLWFSTSYGLNRFDGKTFRNYIADHNSQNIVMSVSENGKGAKIISTYGGGFCKLENDTLTAFKYAGPNPAYTLFNIEYRKKNWIIGLDSIFKLYCVENGHIQQITVKNGAGGEVAFYKIILCSNQLFFASSDGVYTLSGDDKVIPFLHDVVNEPVYDVRVDSKNNYWLGLKNRVEKVYNGKVIKSYYGYFNNFVSAMLVDHADNVWVAAPNAGVLLIKNNGEISNITPKLKIGKIVINDIFEDNDHGIWFASYGKGIYLLYSFAIESYSADDKNLNVFATALHTVGNQTFVGSLGTISVLKNEKLEAVPDKLLAPGTHIYFIEKDSNRLLIGTPYNLLSKNIVNPASETVVLSRGSISYCKDHTGKIWIGSFGGIGVLQNGEVKEPKNMAFLHRKRVNAILEDKEGKLWIGTDSGVIVFNNSTHYYVPLTAKLDKIFVTKIYQDTRNRVWITTDGGLFCMDKQTLHHFTNENGLPHNRCNAIVEDKKHTIWIGTLKGLAQILSDSLLIREYHADVLSDEILSLAVTTENQIIVGKTNGVTIIKNYDNGQVEKAPLLYIMSAYTTKKQYNQPVSIRLPYQKNKLWLEFIGLSYRYPQRVRYRYKIENLDENWHYTDNSEVEISAMPPGNYKFVLSAQQNHGEWSAEKSVFIYVPLPWWKSYWFIAAMVIVTGGLIILLTKWRIVKVESNKRQKLLLHNRMIYLRQQALCALINPHFIFNCMNSIQHYLNRHNNDLANDYLADFARLIRLTMESAQEGFIRLSLELERIEYYLGLEQMRFEEKKLAYHIYVDKSINVHELVIPNMILQSYIENAVWHGIMPKNEAGNIFIDVQLYNDNEIKITIKDDGIGITKSKLNKAGTNKQSLGMGLINERLELLQKLDNQHYSVTAIEIIGDKQEIKGTQVEIILPKKPNIDNFKIE